MIKIDVTKYKDLEHALKIFKKKIRNTKVLENLREGRYFEKPSITNRKKKIKAKFIDKKRKE
jgi:small subunit ribosomal protein S21